MNKLVVSVGIIALGGSVLHAAETGALNAQQTQKAWSVSASLRGFYDDNFNTQPSATKESSTGLEISPSVNYGVAGEQSSVNVGYNFTARYYEKAVAGSSDHSDFTHNFNLTATHALNERVRLNANEQFVIGQEPDLQRGAIDNPQRISGNNVRNYASVGATIQANSRLGFEADYNNTLVDYEDEGVDSQSARLDRMQHGVNLDSRWIVSPQTVGVVGIQLSSTEYSRVESFTFGTNIITLKSSDRNSRGYVINAGLDHEFNSSLSGNFRVGAQHIKFYNDPTSTSEDGWTPWLQGGLQYQYSSQTVVSAGLQYSRSPSDVVGPNGSGTNLTTFVRDTDSAQVYATASHEIAAHLTASGSIRYQSAKFNGGGVDYDGKKDNFLLLGLALAYEFNPNLEGNIGYNYDKLTSGAPGREYTRNKFYVGVTAKY